MLGLTVTFLPFLGPAPAEHYRFLSDGRTEVRIVGAEHAEQLVGVVARRLTPRGPSPRHRRWAVAAWLLAGFENVPFLGGQNVSLGDGGTSGAEVVERVAFG